MSIDTNKQPKISVIIVTYNAAQFLEQSILSVINQNYANIEFIIIDGASTDGTVDIIKRYDDKISYWVSEPDKGIYDAMNKGIDAVTGNWVYFLGAGDILVNVIDKVFELIPNDNTIFYGDVYMPDLLRVFDGEFSKFRSSRMCICHQAIIYPVKAIKKYKFDTKYKVQGDYNLNLKLYGDKEYKFKYYPVIICLYQGGGFSEYTRDEVFFKEKLNILKANLGWSVYLYAKAFYFACKIMKRGEYNIKNKKR